MAKAAKLIVLGAGVAGLQAIATARRLGANVEAFDIRPEVKEQILSLGAKFIEIDVGEAGTGEGGYAKELSEAGKKRQQELLMEKISKADIVITTALVPGKKAPVLITEDAVKKMRTGSVIVDMAAAQGGNCPLSEEGKVVKKHGVAIIGIANYPSLVGADSSLFYGNNIANLLALFAASDKEGNISINFNFEDDIVAASMVTHNGAVRIRQEKIYGNNF
jgi:NAD(P) transhydrogenase subunit alpha